MHDVLLVPIALPRRVYVLQLLEIFRRENSDRRNNRTCWTRFLVNFLIYRTTEAVAAKHLWVELGYMGAVATKAA